jgi:hypothetical protein
MPNATITEAQHTQTTRTREKSENQPDLVILYATYIYGMMWCSAACRPCYYSTLVILLNRKACGMGWLAHDPSHSFPWISATLANCQIPTYHILSQILLQPSPAQNGSHPSVKRHEGNYSQEEIASHRWPSIQLYHEQLGQRSCPPRHINKESKSAILLPRHPWRGTP